MIGNTIRLSVPSNHQIVVGFSFQALGIGPLGVQGLGIQRHGFSVQEVLAAAAPSKGLEVYGSRF